jgi:hypothetical protein
MVNERVPTPTAYIWFGLRWNLVLIIVVLITYVLFSSGNTLIGYLTIPVFLVAFARSWLNAKKGIIRRTSSSTSEANSNQTNKG